MLAALDAAGQSGAVPDDVGKDGIFEAPVVGEMPAPPREVNAGVLGVLFEEDGETRVVLTRRSAELRTHQGQVSFPGGRLDEGEDASSAALREACRRGRPRSRRSSRPWAGCTR